MGKYLSILRNAFTLPEIMVGDSHAFYLKTGEDKVVGVCHSVKELKNALKANPLALDYHDGEHFASWVEKVFNNKTLARKVRMAPKGKISRIL